MRDYSDPDRHPRPGPRRTDHQPRRLRRRRGELRVEPDQSGDGRRRHRHRRGVPGRRRPGTRRVHEPVPRRREPARRRAARSLHLPGDVGSRRHDREVVVTAASGIEIALLDAAGKILGLPVYQLLGSKYRDEVRLYCDCHAGEAYAVEDGATAYAGAEAYSPEAYAAEAARVTDMGFSALKFDLDLPADNENDPYNGRLNNAAIREKKDRRGRPRGSATTSTSPSTATGTTPSRVRSGSPTS